MTIFTEIPKRVSTLDEFQAPLSDVLGAVGREALTYSPFSSVIRGGELVKAQEGRPRGFLGIGGRYEPETSLLRPEDAKRRVQDSGVDLAIPDEGIRGGALDILIERKREEMQRQDVIARGPGGVVAGFARFGAAFGASMLDPLNVASAFIPVVGQAKYASMLKAAGGTLGRAAVRARVGAVEGAVGAAIVEPLIYTAATQEQADYDLTDSLLNIGFGSVFGGGLHVGAGAVKEAVDKGLTWRQARPAPGEAVPKMLDSLDMPAREAALRTGVAQALNGRNIDIQHLLPEGGIPQLRARSASEIGRYQSSVGVTMRERFGAIGLDEVEADAHAALIDTTYVSMARRAGMSVEDLVARRPLPEVGRAAGARPELAEGMLQGQTARINPGAIARAAPDGVVSDLDGVTIRKRGDEFLAEIDGREVGRLNLADRGAYPTSVTVDPAHRRQGVATKLYDAVEKVIGRRMIPSPLGASDSAMAFWKRRLATMDLEERQALLSEGVEIGREAGVPKSATERMTKLGYDPNDPRILHQAARGAITFDPTGKSVISLFEGADESTVLHESGHFFLEMLKSLATGSDAPAALKADWDVVSSWWKSNADAVAADSPKAGITAAQVNTYLDRGTTGDAVVDAAINVGLHEQWTRGFEAYLREGVAPTPELQGIFERFKEWLTRIYEHARKLNVNITPEVRGVFDRMLGAEQRPNPRRLQEAAARANAPEAIRMADPEAVRAADETLKAPDPTQQAETADPSAGLPDLGVAEAEEDAIRVATALGAPDLVARELAPFDELADTAAAYGRAVEAAALCQTRRGV